MIATGSTSPATLLVVVVLVVAAVVAVFVMEQR